MKHRLPLLVSAVMATLVLCGCATTVEGQDQERFAVEAGTVAIIEQAGMPGKRAAEIVESIDKLQTLLTDQQTTVGDLRNTLLRRVAERELSPGEKALALEVISRVSEQVEVRVGKGYLSPDTILSVNKVLSWSKNMAALYVPQSR